MQKMFDAKGRLSSLSCAAQIVRTGLFEIPSNSRLLGPMLPLIYGQMLRVTNDFDLTQQYPWRTRLIDAYGRRYKVEEGLRRAGNIDRDGELKDVFHHVAFAHNPSALAPATPFIRALNALGMEGLRASLTLAKNLDRLYGLNLSPFIANGFAIVRVIRYHGGHPVAARQHVDRAAFTFHVHATHRGLQIWCGGHWISVNECSLQEIAVFLGEKFVALTGGRFGLGTLHGVQRVERIDEDRLAIIIFVHPAGTQEHARWLLSNRSRIEVFEKQHSL